METFDNKATKFSLENHSFLFPNRFHLKNIFLSPRIPLYYGLCGGMCYTALDIFYLEGKTPNHVNPDALPKNLLSYLINRQLQSTGFRSIFRLIFWLFQPSKNLLLKSITYELPKIITNLQTGHPVPIIIVRSKYLKNPTNNHQILITGYKIEGEITNLTCYDPNYPGRFTNLWINKSADRLEIKQSTGESVRGYFVNYYKRKKPKKLF
ncbi:MAG: hypothetical protein CL609_19305 [Anaerolineaceae bacterium]|nr:hypothetical protein [Anaerolineaceae bacterium]